MSWEIRDGWQPYVHKIDTRFQFHLTHPTDHNLGIFAANILNMVTDAMLDLKEVGQDTVNGLSIGTMNYDPG